MQRLSRLAWACLAIGAALATPLTASATYQDRFSMAGSGAAAAFGSCEPSPAGGQVCTAISIGVASQITKADGTNTSETTLSIDIGRFSLDSTGAFTFISNRRIRSGFVVSQPKAFQCIGLGIIPGHNLHGRRLRRRWNSDGARVVDRARRSHPRCFERTFLEGPVQRQFPR